MRISRPPTLDGDVKGDPAWSGVAPVSELWQTMPSEGAPASERIEVRFAYTADTLYVGAICYDADPAGIIVSETRRDSPLDNTDSFLFILDTYLDRQNAFVFGTNPSALEYDGQVINEGEGGGGGALGIGNVTRQQSGSGGGFNLNWDGSWQVRTHLSESGWSAEFAIPFRTLRYPAGSSQTWGLNIQRNIRRRNESAFWAPLPRQFNLHRVSQAGRLVGLEVPAQRNLKLTPYVLGQAVRADAAPARADLRGDAGADLKYSITPSLTLDATYNTDFAQVEVDEQQVNLDRFNLFFPEKRPFFLENAGLFSVGNPGQTELFFSRRIGVGPEGREIPILAGGRLTGNIGGYSVGLLNMQTEGIDGAAANNFGVVRLRRDLPNRSSAGAIFVTRQATGRLAGPDDHNRAFAADARVGFGKEGIISGFAARTQTPGLSGRDHALDIDAQYNSRTWRISGAYTEVGEDFNPEVGFLQRGGYRFANVFIIRVLRPERFLNLLEVRPHGYYRNYWNFDGFHETGAAHLDVHWVWRNGAEVHTGFNHNLEGVTKPFEIFPGVVVPPGTYKHPEAQFVAMTNQSAPVSFRIQTLNGGFFGGTRQSYSPGVRVRVGEAFSTEVSLQRNAISLPWGSFVTNLAIGRLSYSFSPRVFVQTLAQYNDRADLWSVNLRFGWLFEANTGLFVVYNDSRGLSDGATAGTGRSLAVKVSRVFDLLK